MSDEEELEEPGGLPLWGKVLIGLGVLGLAGIGLLVLLLVFVTPTVVSKVEELHGEKARADIAMLAASVDMYAIENDGRYPATLEGLLAEDPTGRPYASKIPTDPWGRPYLYELPEAGRARVYSLGADGAPGGEGPDADIDNLTGRDR